MDSPKASLTSPFTPLIRVDDAPLSLWSGGVFSSRLFEFTREAPGRGLFS